MPPEPAVKQAIAFVDGQNLFFAARQAFGYTYPDYDQDLSELCGEIRAISREQHRWIKIACAFPVSPTATNKRGITNSDWIKIDRTAYDSCLDARDYRPKKTP